MSLGFEDIVDFFSNFEQHALQLSNYYDLSSMSAETDLANR